MMMGNHRTSCKFTIIKSRQNAYVLRRLPPSSNTLTQQHIAGFTVGNCPISDSFLYFGSQKLLESVKTNFGSQKFLYLGDHLGTATNHQ